MFGDDFKKSLEPIQTSDELLERTRKAIEAARFEQAKASVEETSHSSSRGRASYFWKAAIPVVGVMLICVVGFGVLSHLNSKTDSTKGDKIATHNKALDVSDDALLAIGNQLNEEKVDSYDNTHNYAESTTAGVQDEGDYNVPRSTSSMPDKDSGQLPTYKNSLSIDGKMLSIDSDGTGLFWSDNVNKGAVMTPILLPDFPELEDGDRIEGISYSQDDQVLMIMLSVDGKIVIYEYTYDNGDWKAQ